MGVGDPGLLSAPPGCFGLRDFSSLTLISPLCDRGAGFDAWWRLPPALWLAWKRSKVPDGLAASRRLAFSRCPARQSGVGEERAQTCLLGVEEGTGTDKHARVRTRARKHTHTHTHTHTRTRRSPQCLQATACGSLFGSPSPLGLFGLWQLPAGNPSRARFCLADGCC